MTTAMTAMTDHQLLLGQTRVLSYASGSNPSQRNVGVMADTLTLARKVESKVMR